MLYDEQKMQEYKTAKHTHILCALENMFSIELSPTYGCNNVYMVLSGNNWC